MKRLAAELFLLLLPHAVLSSLAIEITEKGPDRSKRTKANKGIEMHGEWGLWGQKVCSLARLGQLIFD